MFGYAETVHFQTIPVMKTLVRFFLLFITLLPLAGWTQIGPDIPSRPPTDLDRKINAFLQASIDLARQRLSGPSYEYTPGLEDLRNHPADVLVMNVALKYDNQRLIDQMINYYKDKNAASQSPYPADPATLLASAGNQPGPTAASGKGSFLSRLSLLYGVQLIGKGGKQKYNDGYFLARMLYLEPVASVLYNYDLPDSKGRLYGGPGLYLGYGLFGRMRDKGTGFDESYAAFDKNMGYSRFDAGLSLTAGYRLPQGFGASLSYELGMVNVDPGRGKDKTRNRVLSLNLDYPLAALSR